MAEDAAPTVTVAKARTSLAGVWNAELQYRDYQSGKWYGLPYVTSISMVADNVTMIRTSAFDDGPKRGTVWITTVDILANDGTTEHSASFRAGQPVEPTQYKLRLVPRKNGEPSDLTHWVLLSEANGQDDERPARIRETHSREGDLIEAVKEVDFSDDSKEEWLVRNPTVLKWKAPIGVGARP
ncbi:MAG: hypothetical protein ACKOUT_12325 [Novosphingobium sp.]